MFSFYEGTIYTIFLLFAQTLKLFEFRTQTQDKDYTFFEFGTVFRTTHVQRPCSRLAGASADR